MKKISNTKKFFYQAILAFIASGSLCDKIWAMDKENEQTTNFLNQESAELQSLRLNLSNYKEKLANDIKKGKSRHIIKKCEKDIGEIEAKIETLSRPTIGNGDARGASVTESKESSAAYLLKKGLLEIRVQLNPDEDSDSSDGYVSEEKVESPKPKLKRDILKEKFQSSIKTKETTLQRERLELESKNRDLLKLQIEFDKSSGKHLKNSKQRKIDEKNIEIQKIESKISEIENHIRELKATEEGRLRQKEIEEASQKAKQDVKGIDLSGSFDSMKKKMPVVETQEIRDDSKEETEELNKKRKLIIEQSEASKEKRRILEELLTQSKLKKAAKEAKKHKGRLTKEEALAQERKKKEAREGKKEGVFLGAFFSKTTTEMKPAHGLTLRLGNGGEKKGKKWEGGPEGLPEALPILDKGETPTPKTNKVFFENYNFEDLYSKPIEEMRDEEIKFFIEQCKEIINSGSSLKSGAEDRLRELGGSATEDSGIPLEVHTSAAKAPEFLVDKKDVQVAISLETNSAMNKKESSNPVKLSDAIAETNYLIRNLDSFSSKIGVDEGGSSAPATHAPVIDTHSLEHLESLKDRTLEESLELRSKLEQLRDSGDRLFNITRRSLLGTLSKLSLEKSVNNFKKSTGSSKIAELGKIVENIPMQTPGSKPSSLIPHKKEPSKSKAKKWDVDLSNSVDSNATESNAKAIDLLDQIDCLDKRIKAIEARSGNAGPVIRERSNLQDSLNKLRGTEDRSDAVEAKVDGAASNETSVGAPRPKLSLSSIAVGINNLRKSKEKNQSVAAPDESETARKVVTSSAKTSSTASFAEQAIAQREKLRKVSPSNSDDAIVTSGLKETNNPTLVTVSGSVGVGSVSDDDSSTSKNPHRTPSIGLGDKILVSTSSAPTEIAGIDSGKQEESAIQIQKTWREYKGRQFASELRAEKEYKEKLAQENRLTRIIGTEEAREKLAQEAKDYAVESSSKRHSALDLGERQKSVEIETEEECVVFGEQEEKLDTEHEKESATSGALDSEKLVRTEPEPEITEIVAEATALTVAEVPVATEPEDESLGFAEMEERADIEADKADKAEKDRLEAHKNVLKQAAEAANKKAKEKAESERLAKLKLSSVSVQTESSHGANIVQESPEEEPVSELYDSLKNDNNSENFAAKDIVKAFTDLDKSQSGNDSSNLAAKAQDKNINNILKQLKNATTKEEMNSIIKKIMPTDHRGTHKQTIRNIDQLVSNRSMVAASAADDLRPASFGIWAKGTFGKASQEVGNLLDEHEYKSSSYGGTIGFDTLINDKFTIGVAISGAKDEITYKNIKNDKTDITTIMGTLYSGVHFENNFILNGSISFGKSDSKDSDSDKNVTSDLLYGKILAGYQFNVNNASILPIIGVKMINISEPEKTNGILKTKDKDSNFVDGVLGLKISKEFILNKVTIIPELYGSLNYDFSDKEKNKNQILIENTSNLVPINESSDKDKLTKNIGIGLTIKSGMIEYGGNFDALFVDKYQAFAGSIKLRISL